MYIYIYIYIYARPHTDTKTHQWLAAPSARFPRQLPTDLQSPTLRVCAYVHICVHYNTAADKDTLEHTAADKDTLEHTAARPRRGASANTQRFANAPRFHPSPQPAITSHQRFAGGGARYLRWRGCGSLGDGGTGGLLFCNYLFCRHILSTAGPCCFLGGGFGFRVLVPAIPYAARVSGLRARTH